MSRALVVADAEFKKMWTNGVSTLDMAAHYRVTSSIIRNCASRSKLPSRVAKSIDREMLAELWAAGIKNDDIAVELGCGRSTVGFHAKAMGLIPRKHLFDVSKLDRARIEKLWFTSIRTENLLKKVGVSYVRLKDVREAFNLPERSGYPSKSVDELKVLAQAHVAACLARDRAEAKQRARDKTPTLADLPRVGGAPFWTLERDEKIAATAGRYADLVGVATALGKPLQAVQLRWHRLSVVLAA